MDSIQPKDCQWPDPKGGDDCTRSKGHKGRHTWWVPKPGVRYGSRPQAVKPSELRKAPPPSKRVFPNRPIPANVAAKYANAHTVNAEGCWISVYAPMSSGYIPGSYRRDGRAYAVTAHRAAWTHHNGPIPDGMTVHHKCFNRTCVNPDHLGLLSNRDNARRQSGADFPLGQCGYGHPDSSRRLYGRKKPVWRCGECVDERNARTIAQKKAEREAA